MRRAEYVSCFFCPPSVCAANLAIIKAGEQLGIPDFIDSWHSIQYEQKKYHGVGRSFACSLCCACPSPSVRRKVTASPRVLNGDGRLPRSFSAGRDCSYSQPSTIGPPVKCVLPAEKNVSSIAPAVNIARLSFRCQRWTARTFSKSPQLKHSRRTIVVADYTSGNASPFAPGLLIFNSGDWRWMWSYTSLARRMFMLFSSENESMRHERLEVGGVDGRQSCSTSNRHGGDHAIRQAARATTGEIEEMSCKDSVFDQKRFWVWTHVTGNCFGLRNQRATQVLRPCYRTNTKAFAYPNPCLNSCVRR